MIRDSINKIRTAPEIIERQNWLTGYKWLAIATPHRKSDISQLTMGNYQNYTHTEYTFAIFDDLIRIHDTTIHNDSNGTGGSSRPYIPEHYAPELIPLFNKLIEITRIKQSERAEINKQQ